MIRIFGKYFNLFELVFYMFLGIIIFNIFFTIIKSILPQKVKDFFFGLYVCIVGSIIIGIIGRIFYHFKFIEKKPLLTALGHTFLCLFLFIFGINFLKNLLGIKSRRTRSSFRCYTCENRATCKFTNICIYKPKI